MKFGVYLKSGAKPTQGRIGSYHELIAHIVWVQKWNIRGRSWAEWPTNSVTPSRVRCSANTRRTTVCRDHIIFCSDICKLWIQYQQKRIRQLYFQCRWIWDRRFQPKISLYHSNKRSNKVLASLSSQSARSEVDLVRGRLGPRSAWNMFLSVPRIYLVWTCLTLRLKSWTE